MNIFFTSNCPIECAKHLDDKRVVKMCLETAQLLATSINFYGGIATYKSTHVNHPSAIWARKTKANYAWLFRHFIALLSEYTKRFNKVHKCTMYINEFRIGAKYIPNGNLTPFANCAANKSIGVSYKHIKDTTLAYQLYLNDRWDNDKRNPTWYKIAR